MNYLSKMDKLVLLIYICSYLIYLFINNLSSYLYCAVHDHFFHFNSIGYMLACTTDFKKFFIWVSTFKILCFLVLVFFLRKRNEGKFYKYASEILISYFLFDLGFIVGECWNFLVKEFQISAFRVGDVFASGKAGLAFFNIYYYDWYKEISLLVSFFWTALLFFSLYVKGMLNIAYLSKRFVIMSFAPFVFLFLRYLMFKI